MADLFIPGLGESFLLNLFVAFLVILISAFIIRILIYRIMYWYDRRSEMYFGARHYKYGDIFYLIILPLLLILNIAIRAKADSLLLWSFGFILLFLSFMFFINAYQTHKQIQDILLVPTSNIRGLAMGDVEIRGKAVGKHYISPYSKTPCVAYKLLVKRYTGKRNKKYETLIDDQVIDPFYIQDKTGKIEVDPYGALIRLKSSVLKETGPTEKIRKIFDQAGKSFHPDWSRLQIIELVVPLDKEIYVFGRATSKKNVVDPQNSVDAMIIRRGQFFHISDTHEDFVIRNLKIRRFFRIIMGLLLGILFYILMRYLI